MQDPTARKRWKQTQVCLFTPHICPHFTPRLPTSGPCPSCAPGLDSCGALKSRSSLAHPYLYGASVELSFTCCDHRKFQASSRTGRHTVLQNVTVFHTTVTTGKCISLSGSEEAGEKKASCQKCQLSFQTTASSSICREQGVRPSGHLTHRLYSSLQISQRSN